MPEKPGRIWKKKTGKRVVSSENYLLSTAKGKEAKRKIDLSKYITHFVHDVKWVI